MSNRVRAIAFYLPQFYPTPENDVWWEPGFTEWTNVTKAKPLFRGHYQPRLPRDLGFYDLRVPSVRDNQARLAQEAGIEGFCYWHYWFGDGKRLLADVFQEVVATGKPDFPFCLCWANHDWYSKTWDANKPDKLLIAQTYPGESDYRAHFYAMLPAFRDHRYIKVNGKLLFGIFDPNHIKDFSLMKKIWNELAEKEGISGFYFFAFCQYQATIDKLNKTNEYDRITYDNLSELYYKEKGKRLSQLKESWWLKALKIPVTISYDDYVEVSTSYFRKHPSYAPTIDPDFDHTPRSGHKGVIFRNSTPQKWGKLLQAVVDDLSRQPAQERLLFIKAWNEWGEGNYLEPDQRWGTQYLDTLKSIITTDKQR